MRGIGGHSISCCSCLSLPGFPVEQRWLKINFRRLDVFQPILVKWGKHKIHRKLGWFGVGLAAVLVSSGVIILRHFLWVQVVSKLMNLIVFTVLFSIGIAQRRNLDFHRKLMIYSSLALMPPALARLSDSLTGTPILSAVLWLGLLVAIPIFEWTGDRTISSASRLGVSMNAESTVNVGAHSFRVT